MPLKIQCNSLSSRILCASIWIMTPLSYIGPFWSWSFKYFNSLFHFISLSLYVSMQIKECIWKSMTYTILLLETNVPKFIHRWLCYYYHMINICKRIIDLHQNILNSYDSSCSCIAKLCPHDWLAYLFAIIPWCVIWGIGTTSQLILIIQDT